MNNIFGTSPKEERKEKSRYLTSIDFGSESLKLAVGENTPSGVRIVFYGEKKVNGIRNGEIINPSRVSETLKALLKEASDAVSEEITDAVISISGRQVKSRMSRLKFQRPDSMRQIVPSELSSITRKQFKKEFNADDKVYDVIPQRYDVGDVIGLRGEELPGMTGEYITGDFLFASGRKELLRSRNDVLDECGIRAVKAILSPICSARAVLTEQEMENGAALVDIGKGCTGIVVVQNFIVRAIEMIPFGGESISGDIRKVTNISSGWSESLKCSHGCALAEYAHENKKYVLKGEDGSIEGEVEMGLLYSIIEARASEIFDAVKFVIDNSGYADKLPGGVVLTGGSSYISNIQELAKALLGLKVRLGAPRGISNDSTDKCRDMYCSTAVGLLLEGYSRKLSSVLRNSTVEEVAGRSKIHLGKENEGPGLFGGWKGQFNGSSSEEQKSTAKDDSEEKKHREEEEKQRKEEEKRRKEEEKKRKEEEKRRKEEEKRKRDEQKKKESDSFFGTLFGFDNNNKA